MTEFTISNNTIIRILVILTAFTGLLLFFQRVSQQIVWLLIAAFLALALEPAVDKLSKYMPWKNRGAALVIVFSLFVGIFTFLLVSLVPPLVSQATQLVKEVPLYADQHLQNNNIYTVYVKDRLDINKYIGNQQEILSKATSASGVLFSSLLSVLSSLLAIFTIFVFTFFIILGGPGMMETFWKYQPEDKKAHRKKLLTDMYNTVSGFVNGTLLRTIIAAIATVIILLVLKVPYALSLGILVAFFGIIPMVGGVIGAIIVILMTLLFAGTAKALIVIIFFVIYSTFENYVLQPIIFKKSVNISPFITAVAALLGIAAAGFVGALVAIPVAASLQLLAKDYLDNHLEK